MKHEDMNYEMLTRDPYAKAEAQGKQVVLADADVLQVDIDNAKSMQIYSERVKDVREWFGVFTTRKFSSFSGGNHCHIYIKLTAQLDVPTRVALQLYLGSDPTREFLALAQFHLLSDDRSILFFETKDFELIW
jgi:hypothetical protein